MHRRTFEAVQQNLHALQQILVDLEAQLPGTGFSPGAGFSPELDVAESDGELVIELALPGVAREEVQVAVTGNVVAVSGQRAGAAQPRLHTEIPRGPFRRVLVLPRGVTGAPRIEADGGIVRIHLTQIQMSPAIPPVAKA